MLVCGSGVARKATGAYNHNVSTYHSVLLVLGPFQGGRVSAWTVYRESTDSSVFIEDFLDYPTTSKV